MASLKSNSSAKETTFTVRRSDPILVVPAEPTPYEFKRMSDIDDQDGLRFFPPGMGLYKCDPSKRGQDPVCVIRDALAKALVYYYPMAGRLREGTGRKLVVECNGEGAVFVEAEADVGVDVFGDAPMMPIPGAQQLLCGSGNLGYEITDRPLLYIQVTRFKCGGFAFGIEICHVMADGSGLDQFLKALAELARDSRSCPSVMPIWDRHLLSISSIPVKSQFRHLEFQEPDAADDIMLTTPADQMLNRSFFFGPKQLLALRKLLPLHISTKATNFELIMAAVWQSRTIALDYPSELEISVHIIVNARGKRRFRKIPNGFYGNAMVINVARATSGKLKESPLDFALQLVRHASEMATDEFLQSTMEHLVAHNRPHFVITRTYLVSDLTHAVYYPLDFGWGGGVYVGQPFAVPATASFLTKGRNEKGEEGVVVPMCLPDFAMERFVVAIERLTKDPDFPLCESRNELPGVRRTRL